MNNEDTMTYLIRLYSLIKKQSDYLISKYGFIQVKNEELNQIEIRKNEIHFLFKVGVVQGYSWRIKKLACKDAQEYDYWYFLLKKFENKESVFNYFQSLQSEMPQFEKWSIEWYGAALNFEFSFIEQYFPEIFETGEFP